ncbi:MAG: glycosyltransferase, partial [Pirellulaceae bacterium]|nr:glycosyltransferase [Pirellulaceae bacterium]
RRELGLPPMKRAFGRWIHSPLATLCLFPEWYADCQPDWPRNTYTTGFPLWDERNVTALPPQLNDFLNHQEPPIVFTPGSAVLHGQDFFRAAVEATQRLGKSAILLTRFPEQLPRSLPDTIRHFDYIPFSQVLPRAAALVHHGGIGSTAQAMAAGIPQLMMPMAHDQPDNAYRVKKMHIGDWLLPRHFSGRRVAGKLSRLLNSPQIGQHCRKIQEHFRDADPMSQACDVIEKAIR